MLLVATRVLNNAGFWYLLVLWLGALGIQAFFGYLMTGPFVALGDIGKALQLLSAAWWISGLAFIGGMLWTIALGEPAARHDALHDHN